MLALRVLATSAVPTGAGAGVKKSADAAAPRRPGPGGARRGQSASRDEWNDKVLSNGSAGRLTKRAWEQHLNRLTDPPAALEDVCVVVVGSKKAGNIGAIARAAASFECEDLRLVRLPRADIDTNHPRTVAFRLPPRPTDAPPTHHRLTNLPTYPSPTQHAQVAPRVDPTSRASLSSAKGAQHVVHGAGEYASVEDAIADCDAAVAFHVWHDGLDVQSLDDVGALLRAFPGGRMDASMDEGDETDDASKDASNDGVDHNDEGDDDSAPMDGECEESCPLFLEPVTDDTVEIKDTMDTNEDTESSESESSDTTQATQHGWKQRRYDTKPRNQTNRGRGKLALVFGREVDGLTDEEVNMCDAACRIPTGRLVESLSVSHAAVIILSQYYQHRMTSRSKLSELPVMAPAGLWAPPRRSELYPE
jgi:tRNA C32,U32 (ribose-2'-O)-methylase TrmJ